MPFFNAFRLQIWEPVQLATVGVAFVQEGLQTHQVGLDVELVVGQAAVTQGLADGVHTISTLLNPFNLIGELMMSHPQTKTALEQYFESAEYQAHKRKMKALLAEEEGDTQTLYDQGFAAGLEAGKAEERTRIASIEAQSLPGHEALIQTLKFDGQTTGHEAAVQILAAEKAGQAVVREALLQDAPKPLPPILAEFPSALSFAERCGQEWESSSDLQAEFLEAATYVAYREAEASGLIKTSIKEKSAC